MEEDLVEFVNKNNWPTNLEDARAYAQRAITRWKFTKKQQKFVEQVAAAKTINRLQEIVIYTLLSGEGLKVINQR